MIFFFAAGVRSVKFIVLYPNCVSTGPPLLGCSSVIASLCFERIQHQRVTHSPFLACLLLYHNNDNNTFPFRVQRSENKKNNNNPRTDNNSQEAGGDVSIYFCNFFINFTDEKTDENDFSFLLCMHVLSD